MRPWRRSRGRRRRRCGRGATRRSRKATRGGRSGRGGSEATRDAAARLIGADRGRDRAGAQHDGGHQPGGRGARLAAGRQCGHARRRVSVECVSVVQSGESRRRDAARADRQRAARSRAAGRGVRRADADRLGELGRLCDRLSARRGADRRDRARARGADVARRDSGLGAFPLDVRETAIDFLAADGHKWMLGPEGAGIAYIRREHLDRLRPIGVGWHSVVHAADYTQIELESASRRRPATKAARRTWSACSASGRASSCCWSWESRTIAAAILDITDRACERLQRDWGDDRFRPPAGPPRRRAAVGNRVVRAAGPRSAGGEEALPTQQDVVFGCRAGRLRISPHAYNNEEDLDRLVEAHLRLIVIR